MQTHEWAADVLSDDKQISPQNSSDENIEREWTKREFIEQNETPYEVSNETGAEGGEKIFTPSLPDYDEEELIRSQLWEMCQANLEGLAVDVRLTAISKETKIGKRVLRQEYLRIQDAVRSETEKRHEGSSESQLLAEAEKKRLEAKEIYERKVSERSKLIAETENIPLLFQTSLKRCFGYIASDVTAATVALSHVSRLLSNSSGWVFKGSSASGKSELLERGARFLPPECVERFTSGSSQSLAYSGDLSKKYVLGGELRVLKPGEDDEVQRYFRQLISENKITRWVVEKGSDGRLEKKVRETRGPAVFVMTTTSELSAFNDEYANRLSWCSVSDEPELTVDVLKSQAASVSTLSGHKHEKDNQLELEAWQAFHRNLKPLRVLISFAELVIPTSKEVTSRRLFPMLLNYIFASALLHQATRRTTETDEGAYLCADVADYELAHKLMTANAPRVLDPLSKRGREIYNKLKQIYGDSEFKRVNIQTNFSLSEATAKRYVSELLRAGCLRVPDGKQYVYVVGDEPNDVQDLGLIDPQELQERLKGLTGAQD